MRNRRDQHDPFHLLAVAPIQDSFNLINVITDSWNGVNLSPDEQWALNGWDSSTKLRTLCYLLLLDGSDTDPFSFTMRLYLHSRTHDSTEGTDIEKQRCFPRYAYERIISYFEGIVKDCERGYYQHPSALPLWTDENHAEHEYSLHGITTMPSLAFLAVDHYLDWIGIEIFASDCRRRKDALMAHHRRPQQEYHKFFEKGEDRTKAFAYFANRTGWERTRYQLSRALEPAWRSDKPDFRSQLFIVKDLQELHSRVHSGQVKTSAELKTYIDSSLRLRTGDTPGSLLSFHKETKKLLLESKKFFDESGASQTRAEASSTGTSHSLGRSANEFVPQARSLFSHGF